MTYMIKISQTGEPMLQDEHGNEFKFKKPLLILRILLDFVDYAPDNFVKKKSESYIGQSFPLPTGWRVEFEHQIQSLLVEDGWNKISEDSYNEALAYEGLKRVMRKLAILLPEQPEEKKEPVNETWSDIFERFNIEVADKTPTFVTASNLASWMESHYKAPERNPS